MKKFCNYLLIVLACFTCAIFSACGDKFKNLSMSLYSQSGEQIESVSLLIDKDNEDMNKDSVRLGVKFNGIDSKNIGNVAIQSSPLDLANATNFVFDGNTVYFDLTANHAGNGKLKVTHLTTNKSSEFDLHIGQKSNSINLIEDTYILSIPTEGEKEVLIDGSKLVSLFPIGSTDRILFRLAANSSLPNTISTLTEEINGQTLIKGFKFNNQVENEIELGLYPVVCMEGYENKPYTQLPVKFVFMQTLNQTNLTLTTDELHSSYLSNNQVIHLIANDNNQVGEGENSFNFNNLKLNFAYVEDEETILPITNFLRYYDYSLSSSNESVVVLQTGEGIVVQANNFTNSDVEVKLTLTPKDCVGEIRSITKTIKVKGDVKPDDIELTLQGKLVDVSTPIDLFDEYISSGSSLGALFNFKPIESYTLADFKGMHILLNPEILNASFIAGSGIQVFTDSTFTTQITNASTMLGDGRLLRNNRYLLDIHSGSRPVKFYFDNTLNKLVSETITEEDSIFIRYVEDASLINENYELALSVRANYAGNLEYLKTISPTQIDLSFDRQQGLTELIVNAGSLLEGASEFTALQDSHGNDLVAKNVYLDRLIAENEEHHALYIGLHGLKGHNKELTTANLEISVVGGQNNPLKLQVNGSGLQASTTIDYNFSINPLNNVIFLVYDRLTDIGEYQIIFTHANGYKLVLNCYVYENLTKENVGTVVETNAKAFKNSSIDRGEKKFEFADYKADYIVAANQRLNMQIQLKDVYLNSLLVLGYDFSADFSWLLGTEGVGDYLEINKINTSASVYFKKGSFVGENNYITINFKVRVNTFENILTISDPKDITVGVTFFVYEEIKNQDISINQNGKTLYIYDFLGAYDKALSETSFNVSLVDNNLWNYVQAYEQTTDRIGKDDLSLDEDGNKLNASRRVVWHTETAGLLATLNQTDNSISVRAVSPQAAGDSLSIIAEVKQFHNSFTFPVLIRIEKPVIAERVSILSAVETYNDDRENYYVNLKVGEEYVVEAASSSPLGKVTNQEFVVVVADRFGNQDTNSVKVRGNRIVVEENISNANGLKIIVFARDALNTIITSTSQGFDQPPIFLMDGFGDTLGRYKNAYYVLDLLLSDGSEANPYLINNADDFWQINENNGINKNKNYKLMANVDLSNTNYAGEKFIDNFTGTITTNSVVENNVERHFVYTLFGLELNENNPNLFKTFAGTMEYVNIFVRCNYNLTQNQAANLGVFETIAATGRLQNVSVSLSGGVIFNNAATSNFGGLAAINKGDISYTSTSVIGASGNIILTEQNENAIVNFGGLVGVNHGSISGYTAKVEADDTSLIDSSKANIESQSISFSAFIGNEGVTAKLYITSSLTNELSSVGGLVGVNENTNEADKNGTIKNVYVSGKITANQTSNVGGVIGSNFGTENKTLVKLNSERQLTEISKTNTESTVENVKSNVKIQGKNNVGGIVGLNNMGSFVDCHYQILTSNEAYLIGDENVGGIAGKSTNGWFEFCSVFSFRWDYNNLLATFEEKTADIVAGNHVGGIVGYAENGLSSLIEVADETEYLTSSINKSSVNAYLKANNTSGELGGLFCIQNNTTAFATNSYFLGLLEGNYAYYSPTALNDSEHNSNGVALANNRGYLINNVYSVLNNNGVEERAFPTKFAIKKPTNVTDDDYLKGLNNIGFAWAADINGGHAFVSRVGSDGSVLNLPIFDIVPTSISLDSNEFITIGSTEIINFEYYDFILDATDPNYVSTSNALNEKFNTKTIVDFLKIGYTPASLSEVRLFAESTNRNVFVVENNKIVLKGVGKANLVIHSALNPAIQTSVLVNVNRAIGDYALSVDASSIQTFISLNIAKNQAMQIYPITSGKLTYNHTEYQFNANANINLEIMVECETSPEINPFDYILISGIKPDENGKVIVPYDRPFSIAVKENLEGTGFKITVKPFTTIELENETESKMVYLKDKDNKDLSITFNVYTFAGATDISLNFDSALYYVNDTTILTSYVKTDIELDESILMQHVGSVDLSYIDGESTKTIKLTQTGNNIGVEGVRLIDFIKFNSTSFDKSKNLQLTDFSVRVVRETVDKLGIAEDKAITIKINFVLLNGKTANTEFTVFPQRINKIEIKNYIYKTKGSTAENSEITQSNVLRPTGVGLMIIDMAPSNGYYDYLEISDITGSEEVLFAQIDGIAGNRLDVMDTPSSDNKGIKLIKVNGKTTTYVETLISANFSSRMHTISVRAYLNDGTQVGENTFMLDVKMLPSISIEHRDPNNVKILTSKDTTTSVSSSQIALGVDASFKVETQNSDGNVDVDLTFEDGTPAANYFNFVEGNNGFYTLSFNRYDTSLLGKTLKITLTTRSTTNNGNYEETKTAMSLQIVNFVVHNVSVSNSRVNFAIDRDDITREIYGNYNNTVNLEFYFKPSDISFYNNGSFLDTTYRYNPAMPANDTPLSAINDILRQLNTAEGIIKIADGKEDDKYNIEFNDVTKTRELIVKNNLNDPKMDVYFDLALNEHNNYKFTLSDDVYLSYALNFTNVASEEEPNVIKNEQDFLNMNPADEFYILGTDLTLSNYTPLDIELKKFDGNGHTITITSFADFTDANIQIGLFKQIYPGMLVANLTVEYAGSVSTLGSVSKGKNGFVVDYYDICNSSEVDYSSARFGGLTPVNHGLITNCKTSGSVAFRASAIEENRTSASGSRYSIDFNLAGLVAENSSTGRITNSSSEMRIFAQANLAGFVHTNAGKIVSSEFGENGVLYAYNNSVSTTIVSEVAGFVVNNSGEISMSRVNTKSTEFTNRTFGNISAKDLSAGFVYTNTNKIYDCYVLMERVGANNNDFSGFVYTNSGTINNVYTYINQGSKTSSSVNMFAPSQTTGITNSIEIVNVTSGYASNIENLTTLPIEDRVTGEKYRDLGFVFGDNVSAVWTIKSGETPTIVSINEKVESVDNSSATEYNGYKVTEVMQGLRAIYEYVVPITDEATGQITENIKYVVLDNTYGSKTNPYLIYDAESWNIYFNRPNNKYYRIIADINFNSGNPGTSATTFSGNIQGNNMTISGIMLYSSENLAAIGLFEEMLGGEDLSVENAVRNLSLSVNSIQAVKTGAVGALAGIVENFNLYNIKLDSQGVIVVGQNAVGGLVGVVRGKFDVEKLSSNVGANATRSTSRNTLALYKSRSNNAQVSENLNSVYYAGSLFGVVDGYTSRAVSNKRVLNSNSYSTIQNVSVNGSVTVVGDTVGAMFGFVGEFVKVEKATINLTSGRLVGNHYSALAVGENRGVLNGITATAEANVFNDANQVLGGLVGLNLGGFIDNSYVKATIVKLNDYNSTVGGIVGRNINGYINNSTFDGELLGYFVGGIIGADYNKSTLENRKTGVGAIDADCYDVIPSKLEYFIESSAVNSIENYRNLAITKNTFNYWFENINNFYSYSSFKTNFNDSINYTRVLGLMVGVTEVASEDNKPVSNIEITNYGMSTMKIDGESIDVLSFNGNAAVDRVGILTNAKLYNGAGLNSELGYNLPLSNIITSLQTEFDYVTYPIGARVGSMDNWTRRDYADELLVFASKGAEISELSTDNPNAKIFISVGNNNEYAVRACFFKKDETLSTELTTLTMNVGFVSGDDIKIKISSSEEPIDYITSVEMQIEDNKCSLEILKGETSIFKFVFTIKTEILDVE